MYLHNVQLCTHINPTLSRSGQAGGERGTHRGTVIEIIDRRAPGAPGTARDHAYDIYLTRKKNVKLHNVTESLERPQNYMKVSVNVFSEVCEKGYEKLQDYKCALQESIFYFKLFQINYFQRQPLATYFSRSISGI